MVEATPLLPEATLTMNVRLRTPALLALAAGAPMLFAGSTFAGPATVRECVSDQVVQVCALSTDGANPRAEVKILKNVDSPTQVAVEVFNATAWKKETHLVNSASHTTKWTVVVSGAVKDGAFVSVTINGEVLKVDVR